MVSSVGSTVLSIVSSQALISELSTQCYELRGIL